MKNQIRTPFDFGGHEANAELRYVQHYTTDDNADQPVQVTLVRWTGSALAAYGNPFRIGDSSTAASVTSGDRVWIIWRSDANRWYPISSQAETFRLLRGKVMGNVTAQDATFNVDNLVDLAGGLDPSGGDSNVFVLVANLYQLAYSDDQSIVIVFSPGVSLAPFAVWEPLKTGGSAAEKCMIIIRSESSGNAVDAAAKVAAGPTMLPATFQAEKMERDDNGRYEPTGEMIEVENRLPDAIPAPPDGEVYIGKAEFWDGAWDLEVGSCKSVKEQN